MQNLDQRKYSHSDSLRRLSDQYHIDVKPTVIVQSPFKHEFSAADPGHQSDTRPAPFFLIQNDESVSSVESIPQSGDFYQSPHSSGMALHADAFHQSLTHNPKRAYRQRRKDPSCDACRDRKVKCDATETTSCTECSSRNVRCQFTKDTNRRMSTIK